MVQLRWNGGRWERTMVQLRWIGSRVGKDNGTTEMDW